MLGGKAVFIPQNPLLLSLSLGFRAFGLREKLQGFAQPQHHAGKSGWWGQWLKSRGPESEKGKAIPRGYSRAQNLKGCMCACGHGGGGGGGDGGKWHMVPPALWTGGQGDRAFHSQYHLLFQNLQNIEGTLIQRPLARGLIHYLQGQSWLTVGPYYTTWGQNNNC